MSTATVSRTVSTDKRFYGVYSATVTKVEDDQGKEGRVKIICHWFDEQMETDWCRVAQIYAGNGYGAFFVPEPGDEVLLAFDNGDMRAPIILGGLYNGKDKPPTFRSSNQDQKMIHTKGGSELLFDDTANQQRVRLKTPGGHTADLSDVDKKITLQSSGGQSVVIDDSANKVVVQTGGSTVEVDASGTITLTGTTLVLSAASVELGGSGAAHPLVWGDALMAWLATLGAHTHVCTAPATPSGPPVVVVPPAGMLSPISKTS
jgi:phage baseplate assembly protein V